MSYESVRQWVESQNYDYQSEIESQITSRDELTTERINQIIESFTKSEARKESPRFRMTEQQRYGFEKALSKINTNDYSRPEVYKRVLSSKFSFEERLSIRRDELRSISSEDDLKDYGLTKRAGVSTVMDRFGFKEEDRPFVEEELNRIQRSIGE